MSQPVPPQFKNRTTPGVYITELPAFPPAIVGVQTAIPAFLGYTQQATSPGDSLLLKPVSITSMADFEAYFGGPSQPLYDIVPAPAGVTPDFSAASQGFVLTPTPSSPRFNLYQSMQLFYANGGGNCYVVSVGIYTDAVTLSALEAGLDAIANQVGPTILLAPDAILLPASGTAPNSTVPISSEYNTFVQKALTLANTLHDRVALFDLYGTDSVTSDTASTNLEACVQAFQNAAAAANLADPSYGIAYFPFLNTPLLSGGQINYTNFNPNTAGTPLKQILTLFNQAQNSSSPATQAKVQGDIDALDPTAPHDSPAVTTQNNQLLNALPQYQPLLSILAGKAGVLPASPALAGVYTSIDQARGVWSAPANLALSSVDSLTFQLDDAQQGSLNVPLNGYAINAIRAFVGRGNVVWGARTLNGNSNDYRYIQVRRTLIYIEQSIKTALNQFVFAPNAQETWTTVTQMIANFLTGVWQEGGLMGDKASDAFTVQCGVPQTMTAQDILNGYMVVQVTLQMIRPAEFINLAFRQTMQGV